MEDEDVILPENYYSWKYLEFEKKMSEIYFYIPFNHKFESPMYKFGSIKFCEFATDIGNFVDTLFKKIEKLEYLDAIDGYSQIKGKPFFPENFRKLIVNKFNFVDIKLSLEYSGITIKPFDRMNDDSPKEIIMNDYWYPKYSRLKHDTEKLFKSWTLKDCTYSLGCAFLLTFFFKKIIINDPSFSGHGFSRYFANLDDSFYNGSKGWAHVAWNYADQFNKMKH